MPRLADVVRQHGPAYVERYGASLLPSHAHALDAILRCRTPLMGGHVAVCAQCGVEHLLFHSCRNRACPQCGFDATCRWVEGQKRFLLPVRYFHVVFTLPAELRRVVRANQKALIPALFQAAHESLARLCRDRKYLGAEIGALAVLHTWTRTLEYHPHVHMLVPGVGLDRDGTTIRTVPKRKKRFLVPVEAVGAIFRARFLELARRALPDETIDEPPRKSWIVFAKAAVQGADKVIEYLGRYVHKTAISDRAIVDCREETVTFQYRDTRNGLRKQMTLPGQEFLRRFLQHVLPKGMHRVRAFGLLHHAHRETLRRMQSALVPRRPPEGTEPVTATARSPRRCPACGTGELVIVARLSANECLARVEAETRQPRGPPLGALVVPVLGAVA